jgi:hypothetical protein
MSDILLVRIGMRIAARQFQVGTQRGDGCVDLVGRVGSKALQGHDRIFDPFGHNIERARQQPKLVLARSR